MRSLRSLKPIGAEILSLMIRRKAIRPSPARKAAARPGGGRAMRADGGQRRDEGHPVHIAVIAPLATVDQQGLAIRVKADFSRHAAARIAGAVVDTPSAGKLCDGPFGGDIVDHDLMHAAVRILVVVFRNEVVRWRQSGRRRS